MRNQDTPSEKIQVRVDPDLKELIPGYLENRERDLVVYQKALEKDDFDRIVVLSHSMKGSGGGYGFNDLSTIGRALEKAARKRDKESVRKSIINLTDYLNKLEIVYD